MTQRIQRHPFLALFDGPDTNTTTEKRSSSTVPLQALFWMNSPLVGEQAEAFSRRLIASDSAHGTRVRRAYLAAYAREASPSDVESCLAYLARYRDEASRSGSEPANIELHSWTSLARIIFSSNEFVYVD